MLYEVEGDILDGSYDIICHQVNCRGVMGAGLAKQIRVKYPEAYRDYKLYVSDFSAIRNSFNSTIFNRKSLLGLCRISKCKNTYIVHLFAQEDYGTDKRKTNYYAFHECLKGLINELYIRPEFKDKKYKIAFPYKIGCGLAGGDWDFIKPLIEQFANYVDYDVYIVKLAK